MIISTDLTPFWWILGNTANLLGIVGSFCAGYAAWRLYRENKKLRQLAKVAPRIENFSERCDVHQDIRSFAPMALVFSLLSGGQSIRHDVETFLRSKHWQMPIEEIKMTGINSRADIETFVNEINSLRRLCSERHYTEVHLFIAGPIQAGTIAGAMLDNWIPVKLYHKPTPPPPEMYEYWMPLMG